MDRLCGKVAMTRQNFYKQRTARQRQAVDDELIVQLVKRERALQSRLGGRKLHVVLKDELSKTGVSIGRDRFFGVLKSHNLLIEALPRSAKTTNSKHSLPVFRNLIQGTEVTAPNQVWVSDITYIRTDQNFVYLALIMDLFSRKIVGYHCGDTLEAIGCIKALDSALKELPAGQLPIHHSDRGSQYCCHAYVDRLGPIPISMTEVNHCYENAHAERLNAIVKQEYGLGQTFRTKDQAYVAVDQAVWLYNTKRPHTSLNFQYPADVHKPAA